MKPFIEQRDTDVLVIGGGLAGTTAAVFAKETNPGLRVTLVDKSTVGRSGQSTFTAGVYLVFFPEEDDREQWMQEMIVRGEFVADQAWVARYLDLVHEHALLFDLWGQ